MNYTKHYNSLIERAKNRSILPSVYKETHHIKPKCIGGTDDRNNLVDLLPEEHLVAHLLLSKMYPFERGLVHAAWLMVNGRNNTGFKYNNKKYAWVRKKHAEETSKRLLENNPFKGKKHSTAAKLKMSEAAKNRVPWNKGKTNVQIPWNKGLNKENSNIIKNMSDSRKGEKNPMFGKTTAVAIGVSFIDDAGNLVKHFKSLNQFRIYCREHDIPFNGFHKMLDNESTVYQNNRYSRFNGYNLIKGSVVAS